MAILWVSTGPCLNTATVEFVKVSRVPCIKMNRLFSIICPQWTKVLWQPQNGFECQRSMGVIIPFGGLVSNVSTVFCTWCAATASAMSLGWTELAPSVISSKHKVLPEENDQIEHRRKSFNVVLLKPWKLELFKKKHKGFFLLPRWKLMNL